MYSHTYECFYMSEIKDSNYKRNGREELGLFSYFKVLTLPGKEYSVI